MAVVAQHAGGLDGLHVGGLGVYVFFTLSGLLITRSLLALRGRPGAWWLFVRRRAYRLWPAWCVALVVALAWGVPAAWRWLPWHLVWATNWVPVLTGADLGRVLRWWSLAVEEQYYLVWAPVVLVLGARLRWPFLVLVGLGVAHHCFMPTDALGLGTGVALPWLAAGGWLAVETWRPPIAVALVATAAGIALQATGVPPATAMVCHVPLTAWVVSQADRGRLRVLASFPGLPRLGFVSSARRCDRHRIAARKPSFAVVALAGRGWLVLKAEG